MEVNGTTLIKRPVDEVWAYVIDVANDANWRNGVDESRLISGESADVGSIGITTAGNRTVEWRVDKLVPGERLEWELLSGPLVGQGGYDLVPVEGGTRFTLLADLEPPGIFKFLGSLFGWIGRRRNQADVETLRDILENNN